MRGEEAPSAAVTSSQVTVYIPHGLRHRVGNRRQVQSHGQTVGEVISNLEREFPGLSFNVRHETGELRRFVNIFVDGEDVRFLNGLDTEVPGGSTIHIMHSVAGG